MGWFSRAAVSLSLALTLARGAEEPPPATPPPAPAPTRQEQEDLAKLRAMDLFPEVEKENSALHRAVADEVERLELMKPSEFEDPAWPVKVTRRIAARLHLEPRTLAQIKEDPTKAFHLDYKDDPAFHELIIHSAHYEQGGASYDILPVVLEAMVGNSLRLDVEEKLRPSILELDVRAQKAQGAADYWQAQRRMMEGGAGGSSKAPAKVLIVFETRGKKETVSAAPGQRIEITEEGAVVKKKGAGER